MLHLFLIAASWTKVFSHDTSGGLFVNINDAKNKNSDDPSAALFSILDQLEGMRNSDGKFYLKLCYPELTQFNPPCNEWIQTSNPATETAITGYKEVQVTFQGSAERTGAKFGGLELVTSKSPGRTWIDADPSHGNWWYAIGALRNHGGRHTIPGPVDGNQKGFPVRKVELFVTLDPTKGNKST